MTKPYILCHMMTSVDGRIDCAMTEHLPGVQEYYDTLDALDAPPRVSGRVTAQLEMACPGAFRSRRGGAGRFLCSQRDRYPGDQLSDITGGNLKTWKTLLLFPNI